MSTSVAMEMVFGVNNKVWPSGVDLATKELPMVPLAPGLFSTTTACPKRGANFSAKRRANASVSPPGG